MEVVRDVQLIGSVSYVNDYAEKLAELMRDHDTYSGFVAILVRKDGAVETVLAGNAHTLLTAGVAATTILLDGISEGIEAIASDVDDEVKKIKGN